MENSSEVQNTQMLESQYHNHIYNKKGEKHPFLLQFKQLKYYYNLRKKFKIIISENNPKKDENNLNPPRNVVQNLYCLIDRKWLIKWKKHVGYKEIINKIKEDKMERDLDNNDYKWISEIIDKSYKENYLNPLDNNTIYKDNVINPMADFKVIHKDCLKLFNINSKNTIINNNFRKYPLRIFKNKYILILNNDMLYIVFKNINSQKIKEIVIDFIEKGENNIEDNKSQSKEKNISNKKKIIDILFNKDINEWLNKIEFKNFELEKELEYNQCKIKIYNKTLLKKIERNQMRNSVYPNINNERNELLNSNILPNNLTKIITMQSKIDQFMMREIKPIDNNNNKNIKTSMVFEIFNTKNLLKDSNINSGNDGEKDNNNNKILENNNNNNQGMLNPSTGIILTSKINGNTVIKKNKDNNDDNDDNQFFNSNKKNGNDNKKQNNNNSDSNHKQFNNFFNNQQNIPQNQDNYFNNNQNISQNNNNINNYNIQNQIQCNNNNINQNNNNHILCQNNNNQILCQNNNNQILCQNNNNQILCQNNNMIINNNFNNQQNNQFSNSNNVQNNMQQQNNLPFNFNQNMQFNNDFQNNQNNNLMPINQQNHNNNNLLMMMFNYYNNLMNNQNLMNNYINNNQNNNNSGIQYPHKSGLQNIGQTCYMNATIECLSNIKEVTDNLLNLNENFIPSEKNLTISYRSLLIELFLSGQKCIVPHVFKSVIGELNPLFQGMHAADSKDLVFFIIERLHLELNEANKNIPNMQKDFYQLELESRDENLMLQNFFNDFKLKNNSIISETFYGITRSIMDCKGCGIKKYSFQSFNMQIFQLKKLKEDKLLYYQNNTKLNLIEAFMLQQMPESLINENMIYCNNCKGLTNGVHQQFIYQLPKVLIIILNRGKNNEDFNEEFDFPVILDLKNHNVIAGQNSPDLFYLCGIITHLGESSSGGHFIAYCRNNQNSNFTFYNDSIVSEASVESAISSKISDNVNEKKTPYILFYHCFFIN